MGREGGLARVRKHGNPGTPEGRRLGGLHSLKTHAYTGTGFKMLKRFPIPPPSSELAELLGILAGDGHIGDYQVTVTTNADTDIEHAKYVKRLFEKLFPIKASIMFRKSCHACVIVVYSRHIGDILIRKGMVRGHKIAKKLAVPAWIEKNDAYRRAYIRGLFDTDGSVYQDVHTIRGVRYENLGMAFTNRCMPLLSGFRESLEYFGFHPTKKSRYVVFLRREKEIRRYFEIVGSSNPKHLRRAQI